MKDLSADLLAEYLELAELAATLTPEQWHQTTPFYGWTPWDEIAHLCFFDNAGLLAATDPRSFSRDADELNRQMANGAEISAIARDRFRNLDARQLVQYWRGRFTLLAEVLSSMDPRARLPWYGPMMSTRSFASARIMETWAHGQDIYDCLAQRRPSSVRLKHIAHIGVATFDWTFVNRKLPVPKPAPRIELRAPDGGLWAWNTRSGNEYVRGSAEDFCLVVTQRRNVLDTQLEYSGRGTAQWLSIAQCFAGPAADGPEPGARVPRYSVIDAGTSRRRI